jgi:hypothetical protein
MTNYCLVLPYLQGGAELAMKFAEKNCGHSKDHDEFYKLAGISREQVWIQSSPPGSGAPDLGIISIETEDPELQQCKIELLNSRLYVLFS